MKNIFKKYKKYIILVIIGIVLIISGLLSWKIYFSKYYLFQKQEKEFTEAVKRFYSLNSQYLPSTNNSKDITLQFLYDGNHINDLVIPDDTTKLCDSDSFVRVYKNDKEEYIYTTYLSCGKYHSNIDSKGPVITLNGNNQITISIGSEYKDPGIKSVVDDKDGKMDVSLVTIDSSKVDTSKVGIYPVTYTVKDSTNNKTVVTRNVVVAYNLTNEVKKNTQSDGYYKGNEVNNYILFSGMLFRIVKVNEDGSIKIISDQAVTNLNAKYDKYENSNIDTWLKEVYLKNINKSDKYLVESDYCVGNIESINSYSNYCSETIKAKVGLLNIDEYKLTLGGSGSSIYSPSFMIANKMGDKYVNAPFDIPKDSLVINALASIRPVMTLRNNLYLIGGNGSYDNPYKLDDYSYAQANDKLNTRLVGEYVEYSGLVFRIIGHDKNNNVRLIMNSSWIVQPNNTSLSVSISNIKNYEFNVNEHGNIGYIINNDYLDYINTKYMVDTEYDIPTNNSDLRYDQYETKKVTAKIVLPKTYELFAIYTGVEQNDIVGNLYIDKSLKENTVFINYDAYNTVTTVSKDFRLNYPIKAVITLVGNLKIAGGKGTISEPYRLRLV